MRPHPDHSGQAHRIDIDIRGDAAWRFLAELPHEFPRAGQTHLFIREGHEYEAGSALLVLEAFVPRGQQGRAAPVVDGALSRAGPVEMRGDQNRARRVPRRFPRGQRAHQIRKFGLLDFLLLEALGLAIRLGEHLPQGGRPVRVRAREAGEALRDDFRSKEIYGDVLALGWGGENAPSDQRAHTLRETRPGNHTFKSIPPGDVSAGQSSGRVFATNCSMWASASSRG